MYHIAVLLNGGIVGDSRVIKTINTLSNNDSRLIDVFYITPTSNDKEIFNKNVRLFPYNLVETLYNKIIKHTLFYNEYLFFVKEVLNTGINYNFIYANDLPCLRPAVILKKKLGAKVVYDSHEIYNETINQFFPHGNLFKKPIFKFLIWFMKIAGQKKERALLKKTDYFITVGEYLKQYFESKYKFPNIFVLRNVPPYNKLKEKRNLHEQLGLVPSKKIAIYQGMLNPGRALFQMVESFQYVNNDIVLCILGRGTYLKDLKKLVVNLNLTDRVFFMDPVDSRILISYTSSATCGICLLEPLNLSCYYAAPNKLYEYIQAGIPIVASNTPECALLLSEFQIGKLVSNDPKEIGNAINTIASEGANNYKNECEKASFKYNWENQEHLITEIIEGRFGL